MKGHKTPKLFEGLYAQWYCPIKIRHKGRSLGEFPRPHCYYYLQFIDEEMETMGDFENLPRLHTSKYQS